MRAFPFGAFLRVAASLWYILVQEFMVPTANYFDDFVTLATTGEAPALTACIHMVLKMLGWDFAGTGPKAPVSCAVPSLGVQLDVSRLSRALLQLATQMDGDVSWSRR